MEQQRRHGRTTGMEEINEAKRVEREEGHGNYLKETEKGEKKQSRNSHKIHGTTSPTHCN